jgi:hypothetical protein
MANRFLIQQLSLPNDSHVFFLLDMILPARIMLLPPLPNIILSPGPPFIISLPFVPTRKLSPIVPFIIAPCTYATGRANESSNADKAIIPDINKIAAMIYFN